MRLNSIVRYAVTIVAFTMLNASISYAKNNKKEQTGHSSQVAKPEDAAVDTLSIDTLHFGPRQVESNGETLDGVAAIVGDDVITKQEVKSDSKDLESKKLNELIYQKLLLQEAKKYNIQVGDTTLNLKLEELASQNKMTLAQFQKKIEQKVSFASYREELRNELIIRQLQQVIANQFVKITNREVEDFIEKRLKQVDDSVNLEDILIKVPKTSDEAELSKAQNLAAKIIEELKTKAPDAVAAEYPNVEYNKLGWVAIKQIPVVFSKALFDVPANTYAKPLMDQDGIHILKVTDRKGSDKTGVNFTETKVSHILIKSSPDAEKRINDVYSKLLAGADFAQIARNYSEDSGSAVRGGDLDWITPGRMVPEFDVAVKDTPVGKFSKPFKSRFGWHIVLVQAQRQVALTNDEMLKRQAKQMIFQKKAGEEWQLWLSRLRDESYVKIF